MWLIDPAVGLLSDRTRNRFGRRKTWIVAGVPIFAARNVAAVRAAGRSHRDVLRFWLVLFWLGFSMINIPYYAWGAELTPDYHERTRITTWRTIFGTLGGFAFLAIPAVRQQLFGVGGTPGQVLSMAAAIALVAVPALVALAVTTVPDRGVGGEAVPLLRGFAVMSRNGPFLRLLAAFTLVGLGPTLQGAMFPFFMQHVVGDTTSGPKILLIYFPTVICGVLIWGALARRIDKHRAWITGMLVMVCATASYMLVGQGDLVMVMIILAVSGIGSGALSALPASMKADVIDLDAVESGEEPRRALLRRMVARRQVRRGRRPGSRVHHARVDRLQRERRQRPQRDLRAARILFGGTDAAVSRRAADRVELSDHRRASRAVARGTRSARCAPRRRLACAPLSTRQCSHDVRDVVVVNILHAERLGSIALPGGLRSWNPATAVVMRLRRARPRRVKPERSGAERVRDIEILFERIADVEMHQIDPVGRRRARIEHQLTAVATTARPCIRLRSHLCVDLETGGQQCLRYFGSDERHQQNSPSRAQQIERVRQRRSGSRMCVCVALDRRCEPGRPPRLEPTAIRFAKTIVREDEFAARRRVAHRPSAHGGDRSVRCVDERVLEHGNPVLRLRRGDQAHGSGGTDVFVRQLEANAAAYPCVYRTFTAEPRR